MMLTEINAASHENGLCSLSMVDHVVSAQSLGRRIMVQLFDSALIDPCHVTEAGAAGIGLYKIPSNSYLKHRLRRFYPLKS